MKTHCLLLIALAASADGLSTLYGTCPVTSPASASPCVLGANGSVEATYVVDSSRRFVVQGAGIDVVQSLPATATSINLMMNEITSVGLSPSSAVQALNLSYNRVPSLDAIASLPTLQSLDLSYNNISDASTLSAQLARFPNLASLSLRGNRISSIQNLKVPPSLQALDLSGNIITTFDVTVATYYALAALTTLNLRGVYITSCAGQVVMLRQAAVCITDAPGPSMLRSMYGPIFVFFGTVLALLVVYLVGKRLLLGPPALTDHTLRATCVSSGYSRMDDDPVEYRISVSLDLDTSDLTSRLRNDEALTTAHKLHLKDIRKLKLISATPLYTTYVAQHLAMKADIKVLTPTASPVDTLAHLSGLVHEISVLARLSHPKVVSLLGYATSSSLLDLTIATEFMSFGSLGAILSEPALAKTLEWTPTSIHAVPKVQLALDVTSAVVYLHTLARPLLHNALSTSTVVVSSKWEAKVSGFAHSSYLDDAASSSTTELLPSAVGMEAPEVQSGGRRSMASDVYLLGHVVLALDGGDETTSTMPEAIATIVARCVDADPTRRPTAAEVAAVLAELI